MELISPVKRKDMNPSTLAKRPCGGTKAGAVHFETTPGSRNLVSWKVTTPAPNGRCIIKVSDSPKEADMVVAKPTDGSASDDGSFPCGRHITDFEAKEIRIPRDLVCDQCLIQLVWMTDEGDQYRCTDFESVASEVPECFGKCLNGGICRNGKCACPEFYSGSNCQFSEIEEDGASSFWSEDIWLLYLIMIILIVLLLFGAYRLFNKEKPVDGRSDRFTAKE